MWIVWLGLFFIIVGIYAFVLFIATEASQLNDIAWTKTLTSVAFIITSFLWGLCTVGKWAMGVL